MRWYENLSNAQILELKDNIRPLMFCPEWMQEAFKFGVQCDGEYLDYEGKWNRVMAFAPTFFNSDGTVLRLRQFWQLPEPEPKQGHWEECEIKTGARPSSDYIPFKLLHDYYWFSRQAKSVDGIRRFVAYDLHQAFSMVGFGGIQFEEVTGYWYTGLRFRSNDGLIEIASDAILNHKPAIPKEVRFWVEG